jgi:hypothetical protein
MTRPADLLYPTSAPKAQPPRIVNGWRELEGGGWIKVNSAVGAITIVDTYAAEAKPMPERMADAFYGDAK